MADGAFKRPNAALYLAKANDTDPQANGLLGGESWPVGWVSELNLGANRNLQRVTLSQFAANRTPRRTPTLGPSSISSMPYRRRQREHIHHATAQDRRARAPTTTILGIFATHSKCS